MTQQPIAQEVQDLEADLEKLTAPGDSDLVLYQKDEEDQHGLSEADYQEIADEMGLSLKEVRDIYAQTQDSMRPEKRAPHMDMPFSEFWEDLLDQGSLNAVQRKEVAQDIKGKALDHAVENYCIEYANKGTLTKVGVHAWAYLKAIGTPAAIGAVLGYLSGGVEGAQQGAIAGSIVSLPLVGLGHLIQYVKRDPSAGKVLQDKDALKFVAKDQIACLEDPKHTVANLFGCSFVYTGSYALGGAVLGLGASLCAGIGLTQAVVEPINSLIKGKKWQNRVRQEIKAHPTRYLPEYVPPKED